MSFITDAAAIPDPIGGDNADFTPPDEREQSRKMDKVLTAMQDLRTAVIGKGNFVTPPANGTAAGTAGDYSGDETHIYLCTATDTWIRCAIEAWPA